jgi:hypothetical protein
MRTPRAIRGNADHDQALRVAIGAAAQNNRLLEVWQ